MQQNKSNIDGLWMKLMSSILFRKDILLNNAFQLEFISKRLEGTLEDALTSVPVLANIIKALIILGLAS